MKSGRTIWAYVEGGNDDGLGFGWDRRGVVGAEHRHLGARGLGRRAAGKGGGADAARVSYQSLRNAILVIRQHPRS